MSGEIGSIMRYAVPAGHILIVRTSGALIPKYVEGESKPIDVVPMYRQYRV